LPFRPGITGAATLAFRKEEEVLRHVHPALLDDYYNRHIRPLKATIDLNYMANSTFLSDLRVLAATVLACILPQADRLNPLAGADLVEGKPVHPALPGFRSDRTYEEA
jgi:lipopolysaccharide/colanic/teichoic acid biosynthesis glycosyltransferase